MFLRTSYAAVCGAALLAALGPSGAASAEPAASECATLRQVQNDLQSGLDELKSHAGSMSAALALSPDDPDRQAAGETMRSMADTLQEASGDVATPAYRKSLTEFSAFLDRNAQLILDGGSASPEEIRQSREEGENLGGAVDTAYAQACAQTVNT